MYHVKSAKSSHTLETVTISGSNISMNSFVKVHISYIKLKLKLYKRYCDKL